MTIPNLPTDNLYKFMALSGLVIFLTGCLFCELNLERKDNEIYTLEVEILKLKTEVKILDFKYHNTADSIIQTSLGTEINTPLNDAIKWYRKSFDYLQLKNKLYSEKALKGELIALKSERIGNELKGFRIILAIILIIAFGGLQLSIKGFKLWHKKVQKPMDEKLLQDLNAIVNEESGN